MVNGSSSVEFQESFANHASFPLNLSLSRTRNYPWKLESYKERLDQNEEDLCLSDEEYVHIPIREFYSDNNNHDIEIRTSEKLCEWLRLDRPQTRLPKCQFIYIYGQNSRDELQLTRNMLTQLLTYFQVMPVYLDFMFIFGAQNDARDLRFSGFYEQSLLKDPLGTSRESSKIPKLGRSGRQFQLCYNLKGVTLARKAELGMNEKNTKWSIRQAALHHQFDVINGMTLWIITKGRLDIYERFKQLTGPDGRLEDKSFEGVCACFRSSLATHLMFCHWSTEDWRWYIGSMEKTIDDETSMALYGTIGPSHTQYKPEHLQELQRWKDRMGETVMILGANIQVITSLRKFYVALKANRDFPLDLKRVCREDIDIFAADLDEIIGTFKLHAGRAKLLVDILGDRKEMILQHLQGQTATRTDELNKNLEREAIVMRIVTIVTLIYLPATFVSTFFSTDIVQYQNSSQQATGNFSPLAMKRWLEVTLPLTTVTLLVAWLIYKNAEMTRTKRENKSQKPIVRKVKKKGVWAASGKWKFWSLRKNRRNASVLPICRELKEVNSSDSRTLDV